VCTSSGRSLIMNCHTCCKMLHHDSDAVNICVSNNQLITYSICIKTGMICLLVYQAWVNYIIAICNKLQLHRNLPINFRPVTITVIKSSATIKCACVFGSHNSKHHYTVLVLMPASTCAFIVYPSNNVQLTSHIRWQK